MLTNLFSRILGDKTVFRKASMPKGRRLSLESLENRELLSVSPLLSTSIGTEHYVEAQCFVNAGSLSEATLAEAVADTPPYNLEETFTLHNNPNSHYTIYLDFDGHTTTGTQWNSSYTGGSAIVTPVFSLDNDPAFNDVELERIQSIWQRVAEDFAPFDVDVTTEEPSPDRLFYSGVGDTEWGVRVAIGGSGTDWYGSNVGGIAYVGSFDDPYYTPAFVFSKNLSGGLEKTVAEAITHEIGHTLGLHHDGTTSSTDNYYSGANGWAPIMGTGYSQDVTQWSQGEYPDANNHEDDLAIITSYIPYKKDDHANDIFSISEADKLKWDTDGFTFVTAAGIIETNTDIDVFQFTLDTNSFVNINIISGTKDTNLDILAALSKADDPAFTAIIQNDTNTMNACFTNIKLAAGTYYISIEGTGKPGVYSDYASLGTYTISGTMENVTPAVPADFQEKADTASPDTVTLQWTQLPDAAGYDIRYTKTAEIDNDVWISVPCDNNTETVMTGLESGTEYTFQIRAVNGSKVSLWSAPITAVTQEPSLLPAPKNLRSIQQAKTTLTLDWNKVDGATGYILQRFNGSSYEQIYIGTDSQYVDRNLLPETIYSYKIQAAGSAFSEAVSAKTLPTSVSDVPAVTSAKLENSKAEMKWADLGTQYTYYIFKNGTLVTQQGQLIAAYTDNNPLTTTKYVVHAYNNLTGEWTKSLPMVLTTAPIKAEFVNHEVTAQGGIKLNWNISQSTQFVVFRNGIPASGNINGQTWADTAPLSSASGNQYVLYVNYLDNDGNSFWTWSSTYVVQKSAAASSLDAFWAEYDSVVDDDVLTNIV